jgi:hypothetical protein
MHLSVMRLEPIDANQSRCKYTLLELKDLGGEIPNFVKDKVAKGTCEYVKKIKTHLEKQK